MLSLKSLLSCCVICQSPFNEDPAICADCATLLSDLCGETQSVTQSYNHHWQQLRGLGLYRDLLAYLVTQGKFNNRSELLIHLAGLFAQQLKPIVATGAGTVCSVPMPYKRRLLRGFNQADVIAREMARKLDLSYQPKLVKHSGESAIQHTLNRKQRLQNRRKAFTCPRQVPERIFLVDDVLTTGATASAICQRLKAAGAQYIEVWVLAITEVA